MTDRSFANYSRLLNQLKQEIQSAKIKALLTVNLQLLILYWRLGKAILTQQQKEGWGTKIIDRLSHDLQQAFPDMKGFSARNLKYMRTFADAYPQFVQAPLAQIGALKEPIDKQPHIQKIRHENAIVQAPLAQLTWYHHITLLDKIKSSDERLFYILKATENNWSRNVLVHQIESGLYQRQGKAVTNFEQTLPAPLSDLARELVKDPYKFDFLDLYDEYKERDLENALMDNLTNFLLELGSGFSFIGRQYSLEVDHKNYTIDLLFYHFKLHCFIAIELKTGEFLPEHAGKLNFYLNLVDEKLKRPDDNATIGLLICKQHSKVIAEYALRGINKPIGISEYHLVEALPENLQGILPTIQQIEEKLRSKPRDNDLI